MEVSDLSGLIKKHKNIILNLVIILVAVHFALGVHKEQNMLLARLKAQKVDEAQKNEVLSKIGGLEGELEEYKRVINEKDVGSSLDIFNTIASTQGVKIISIRPLKETEKGLFTYYPFELRIEAESYHSLGDFVAGLENHNFIFDIDNMKISPSVDPEQQFILTVNLNVKTFVVND